MNSSTPSSIAWLLSLFLFCGISGLHAQSGNETISWGSVLGQNSEWYDSPQATQIADNVLLYQRDIGGWPKNIDMAQPLSDSDVERLQEEKSSEGATIDNEATYTQLRFLARVYNASGQERFRESFLRGLDYLMAAQYENGGWPQYYPIREGYYEFVTFNDGAMIGVMELLRDITRDRQTYVFVPSEKIEETLVALEKGLDVILQTQIPVDGTPTAWCAQYDHRDLSCTHARTYELPSISGSESVGITRFLMEIEEPGSDIIAAVEYAVQWFEKVKMTDLRMIQQESPSLPGGYDRVVGFDPVGNSPTWGRFYEIGTNYPIFVGRDGVKKYALSEIEHERRMGYSWLGSWPQNLLEVDYPAWKASLNQ